MPIEHTVYARAGLVGNPSDGYFGKTIAVSIPNFSATVRLLASESLDVRHDGTTLFSASDLGELCDISRASGYHGETRLTLATLAVFVEHCRRKGLYIRDRKFVLDYRTDIPRGVGLSGSSALIIATLRCLMDFCKVEIPEHGIAKLALSVETEELGIAAGLMDRVLQTYGGCMYMDFQRELMQSRGYGEYKTLGVQLLPALFVAYDPKLAEDSGIRHYNLRERWENNDTDVHDAMVEFARYAQEVHDLLVAERGSEIGPWMDRNFDLRSSLYDVGEGNREMVASARSVGAHAKLAGSGGAIVGSYNDGEMYQNLESVFADTGVCLLRLTF